MPSFVAISVSDLPPGTVREVIHNDRTYAVCNVEGAFFAVSGDCPHHNGPLGHGAIHGHQVVCPWHLWEFDVRTGRSDFAPDCVIATYPTHVDGGAVHITLPEPRGL